MTDEPGREDSRRAEETLAAAREAEDRARAEAERVELESVRLAQASNGEEPIRQLGLIYAGLIGIALIMAQPFLTVPELDASARISVIAFAVAIPLLAGLVLVNAQEAYRRRRSPSVLVRVAQVVAQLAAVVGIVAGFWHMTWVAGVTFLAATLVALGVHSAGYWRVESSGATE